MHRSAFCPQPPPLPVATACPPPGAGVDSGYQLRAEGVIPAGPRGQPAGDLLVQIQVAPSPVFKRQDFDLYVDVPVSMVDACLGTSIE